MRFDHIMMHTSNMDLSIKFFHQVFQMELENTDEYEKFRLAYMSNKISNIKFELREVYGEKHNVPGTVIGHFAFYTDSASAVEARYKNFIDSNMLTKNSNFEIHVSHKHKKRYAIFTCWSPDGVECSALQKLDWIG
jgi:hypothetical protein